MVSQNAVSRVRCNDHFGKKWVSPRKKPSIHGWVCGIHKKKTLHSLSHSNDLPFQRREILAIYMASLALECLYEMAVYRGLIPQLKGGEVALFSLSSAVLTHFHRNKEVQCLVV